MPLVRLRSISGPREEGLVGGTTRGGGTEDEKLDVSVEAVVLI